MLDYDFVLAMLAFLAIMTYMTFGMINSVLEYFEWWRNLKAFISFELLGQNSLNRYKSHLIKYSPYYRTLNSDEKKRFEIRLHSFISEKHFIGKNGFEITEKSKVLISAAAIQITFGLDEYMLYHFSKIYVYPDVFYSKGGRAYHRGEVNLGGSLSLSWKHFEEGFADYGDQRNLGLHEMAHAVKLQNLMKSDYDEAFSRYYHRWFNIVQEKFHKLKSGEGNFLRKYAGTNMHEFFAVCIEHFFEAPERFNRELPEIYLNFCILLNQNPLKTHGYVLNARKYLLNNDNSRISFNRNHKKVFKTNANILTQLKNVYFFFFIPLLILFAILQHAGFMIIFSTIIILLSLFYMFIYKRSHYFLLFPEHLKIKNALSIFSKKHIFHINDIICIFLTDNLSLYTERIQITYIKDAEFKHIQFYFIPDEVELKELVDHLRKKGVPVLFQ